MAICGGSGRGAFVEQESAPHLDSLKVTCAGVDYRVGDIVCVQMDTVRGQTIQPYAIVREIESENKLRFKTIFDGQDDYFRVSDIVIYESDVPTQLRVIFLGKQQTGI